MPPFLNQRSTYLQNVALFSSFSFLSVDPESGAIAYSELIHLVVAKIHYNEQRSGTVFWLKSRIASHDCSK